MTFGPIDSPGDRDTILATPSSSQTTVLGEWRPPPSVAIFQFRLGVHAAVRWTTPPRRPGPACHPCDIGPCRAGMRKRMLGATRGDRPPVTAVEAAAGGGENAEDEAQVPLAAGALPRRAPLLFAPSPRRPGRVRSHLATRRQRPRTLTHCATCPMSMYTRLLDAALAQRRPATTKPTSTTRSTRSFGATPSSRRGYPVAMSTRCPRRWRCRSATTLRWSSWPRSWASTVARAGSNNPNASGNACARRCATGASRSTQRTRRSGSASRRIPRAPDPSSAQVPEASERASCAERSLRRAANVAACVRRSMPSFASRFET